MKWAVVIALAGCGRLGFGSSDPAIDSPIAIDAVPDAFVIPGTIARYSMDDDPSDGVISDDSGRLRHARCVVGGNCPTQIAGRFGMALQFNGTTQSARIINDPIFDTPNAFSIAVWVYLEDPTVDRVAIAKPFGQTSDDSWCFVAWTASMTCLETTTSMGRYDACTTFPTPANRWVHLAGTYDGIERSLYIDGVRSGQLINNMSVVFDSHDIVLGGDENGGSPAYRWKGALDELYFFDRAITQQEVAMLAGL